MVTFIIVHFLLVFAFYQLIRLQWCYHIVTRHQDRVYACVTRWHEWTFEKTNDVYNEFVDERMSLCQKFKGKNSATLYYSFADIPEIMAKFWVFDIKRFIKDEESYNSIRWNNPQDQISSF